MYILVRNYTFYILGHYIDSANLSRLYGMEMNSRIMTVQNHPLIGISKGVATGSLHLSVLDYNRKLDTRSKASPGRLAQKKLNKRKIIKNKYIIQEPRNVI